MAYVLASVIDRNLFDGVLPAIITTPSASPAANSTAVNTILSLVGNAAMRLSPLDSSPSAFVASIRGTVVSYTTYLQRCFQETFRP